MKKVLFFAVAAFGFISANAQDNTIEGFSKGDIVGALSFSINSEKSANEMSKYNFSEIAPSVSYFVTDKISVGLNLGTSKVKYDFDGAASEQSVFSYGLSSRYYFNPQGRFSSSVGVNLALTSGKGGINIDGNFDKNLKSNGNQVNLSYGLNYFVSKNFALLMNVSAIEFKSEKVDGFDKRNTTSEINLNMSAISLGLVYRI